MFLLLHWLVLRDSRSQYAFEALKCRGFRISSNHSHGAGR